MQVLLSLSGCYPKRKQDSENLYEYSFLVPTGGLNHALLLYSLPAQDLNQFTINIKAQQGAEWRRPSDFQNAGPTVHSYQLGSQISFIYLSFGLWTILTHIHIPDYKHSDQQYIVNKIFFFQLFEKVELFQGTFICKSLVTESKHVVVLHPAQLFIVLEVQMHWDNLLVLKRWGVISHVFKKLIVINPKLTYSRRWAAPSRKQLFTELQLPSKYTSKQSIIETLSGCPIAYKWHMPWAAESGNVDWEPIQTTNSVSWNWSSGLEIRF